MDEYTVSCDETTGEYTATAGDATYTTPSSHLAYIWLAAQLMDAEDA